LSASPVSRKFDGVAGRYDALNSAMTAGRANALEAGAEANDFDASEAVLALAFGPERSDDDVIWVPDWATSRFAVEKP
jgi:hypothetical protein